MKEYFFSSSCIAHLMDLHDTNVSCISDNVAGMMYRPTSSGLLVPTSYQFGSNQIFQVIIVFITYKCLFVIMYMQTLIIGFVGNMRI